MGYTRIFGVLENHERRSHGKYSNVMLVRTLLISPCVGWLQWSKACYTFGTAICLLHLGGEEGKKEAVKLFAKVPSLRQRIAGKSIPLEVSYLVRY
jgi:Protein of unknown function (DUF3808)